jgi:hypothetical protein
MQHLPVDEKRGFVVPWFVQWINGEPEFRVMDRRKFYQAIEEHLCWVCGRKLRSNRNPFVVGPMCGVNRVSSEPPSHPACARYSAMACPFLSMPKMRRREDELMATVKVAGIGIKRNPGVALLWFSDFSTFDDGKGGTLFNLREPSATEWYCEGRPATREEVFASITSGLPILQETAEQDGHEAVLLLRRQTARLMRYLPQTQAW